jgi:molecular chaperone DnaK
VHVTVSYGLGLDIGSAFTTAAVGRGGRAEPVILGKAGPGIPTVVFAPRSGPLLGGDAAFQQSVHDPGRYAERFTGRLGDPTPVVIGDTVCSPARLMSVLLREVVTKVTEDQGGAPDAIVLTRPARWGPYKSEQFDEVPRMAGLTDVHTITESVAAAVRYSTAHPLPDGALLAVCDLGSGSVDTSVLRMARSGMEILGETESIEDISGFDIDAAVLEFVDQELGGALSALDPLDPESTALFRRVRRECIRAKEALSFHQTVMVPVALAGDARTVRLTRQQLEKMILPMATASVESILHGLRSANVDAQRLEAVLLVGGSSRIPLTTRMIRSALQRPVLAGVHPDHEVALGAALVAAHLSAPPARPHRLIAPVRRGLNRAWFAPRPRSRVGTGAVPSVHELTP